jgi:5-oxoprolinase (ATP-hydrolysing)
MLRFLRIGNSVPRSQISLSFHLSYPVILRSFSLRENSGGAGLHRGGDGCRRELEFRKPLQLSVLTERRVFQPYGLEGGEPGKRGMNLFHIAKNGRIVNLGSKNSIDVKPGVHNYTQLSND